MDKKQQYFIFLGGSLVIIGCMLGFFYQWQKSSYQLKKIENILGTLNTDVVPSITSYGRVEKINGRNIMLSFNSSLIEFNVADSVPIYGTGKGRSEVDFDQIKIGDELNVQIKINQEKKIFEAESITIFN